MKKRERHNLLLRIIEENEIHTQDALLAKLNELGVQSTQTTISRDIRELKLIKGPTGRGTYKYIAPEAKRNEAPGHNSALTEAVLHIECAQNIVVVKTLSGMANAIAVCVDSFGIGDIIGSVAGDDTILLVVKTLERAAALEKELRDIFGK